MKLLRSLTIAAGVALALLATADLARAGDKGCAGCGHGGLGGLFGGGGGFGGGGAAPRTMFGGHRNNQPAFQAAPWYNYWPYDAHFQTPAPVNGAFYGPPAPGNFPVNPYFPAAGYGAMGFGGAGVRPGLRVRGAERRPAGVDPAADGRPRRPLSPTAERVPPAPEPGAGGTFAFRNRAFPLACRPGAF
jgi:hypothetical protein